MKLAHPLWSLPIEFLENTVQVLTIEHPKIYRKTIGELFDQAEGKEGEFILSDHGKNLKMETGLHIVQDFYHLQPNDRRIQTKILSLVQNTAEEFLEIQALELRRKMQEFLGDLIADLDYSITYDEENFWNAFLKAMNFRLDFEGCSSAEALAEYILIIQKFFRNPCIVLIGAKAWFTDEEMERVYKTVLANKVNLLLIESVQRTAIFPWETHRVIDKDLCELFPRSIME